MLFAGILPPCVCRSRMNGRRTGQATVVCARRLSPAGQGGISLPEAPLPGCFRDRKILKEDAAAPVRGAWIRRSAKAAKRQPTSTRLLVGCRFAVADLQGTRTSGFQRSLRRSLPGEGALEPE